ncbi:MAG TPA: M14 family metallopeptidase [Pirellulaceae bacterium]|jgi:hypothetical protein|nr:M14 family metallopeptidase [Pirellulaceae bacterium]
MAHLEAFSPDYATARKRFREAATRLEWETFAFPIGSDEETGEQFVVDVAVSGGSAGGDPRRTLIVSSGLHGVEGFFGSAVQLAAMENWAKSQGPACRCVFIHALNPYGFARIRRADVDNVDPNRNFLLSGERYQGAPERYSELDPLLNPPPPPRLFDGFLLRGAWTVMRYGMPALKQAIAGGQYDFSHGLFYGGKEPGPARRLLELKLPGWIEGAEQVVHLDFHTGLGGYGTWKLLLDSPLTDAQRTWLLERFDEGCFEEPGSAGSDYVTRGSIGRWLVQRKFAPNYLYACAEFGTFSPISVLSALRAENQVHRWKKPEAAATLRAKRTLLETFCPASPTWRTRALGGGLDLIERSVAGLSLRAQAGAA